MPTTSWKHPVWIDTTHLWCSLLDLHQLSFRMKVSWSILIRNLRLGQTVSIKHIDQTVLTKWYVRNPKTVAIPVRIYTYTDFAMEIWGFSRHLIDTLRYHHTRYSRASGLLASISQHVYQIGRKVEFTRSCPLFFASFGKLRLSDQVQFNAWHGIQRQIIWIFCIESEVSG